MFVILIFGLLINTNNTGLSIDQKRSIHQKNLANSPFSDSKYLSKSTRKSLQLPPNPYYEKIWELSINPITGRTEPEKILKLQDDLRKSRLLARRSAVPGENEEMKWIQRGPINVGGRTKAMMFDPNDSTNETVFSGGISGGLFKNTKI